MVHRHLHLNSVKATALSCLQPFAKVLTTSLYPNTCNEPELLQRTGLAESSRNLSPDSSFKAHLHIMQGGTTSFCLQVEQGADLLDINMDDGLIEGVGAMTRFVNLLVADPETSRVPFMIDSSKVSESFPTFMLCSAMSMS